MLEDQRPQDHGCHQSAPTLILRMALGEGLHDAIDENLVIEHRVALPQGGIPELVGVGLERSHETTLPLRSRQFVYTYACLLRRTWSPHEDYQAAGTRCDSQSLAPT